MLAHHACLQASEITLPPCTPVVQSHPTAAGSGAAADGSSGNSTGAQPGATRAAGAPSQLPDDYLAVSHMQLAALEGTQEALVDGGSLMAVVLESVDPQTLPQLRCHRSDACPVVLPVVAMEANSACHALALAEVLAADDGCPLSVLQL